MGYGPVRKARGMHGCAFPGFIRPTVIFLPFAVDVKRILEQGWST